MRSATQRSWSKSGSAKTGERVRTKARKEKMILLIAATLGYKFVLCMYCLYLRRVDLDYSISK